MGKQNIEKYSAGYSLLKSVAGFWHNNIYYRRVIVFGRDNINSEYANIFAPNHQNALMDALAVLFTHKGQPVFLARADIFKRKIIASILYFLKILPVYRIRDGFGSLKENDDTFFKTIDVMKNRNGLVILPEGDHAGFRRLRQLKKGICRIAFQSEEAAGFDLRSRIIPVALEFTNYSRVRQVLTVVYGKPIQVSDFISRYKENPDRAFNELRSKLSDEMKNLMVHIESEQDYEALDELRSIINGRYSDSVKFPKIFRDRILIDKMNRLRASDETKYRMICNMSLDIKKGTIQHKLTYRLLAKKKHPLIGLVAGVIGLIASFPLFVFGNIFNLTFLGIPALQIPKIKDPQFHSSIRYGLSLALALVVLPLYLVLSLLIFSPWWLGLLVFISLPLSGLFAWNYYLLLNRIRGGFRIRKLIGRHDPEFERLKKEHSEITKLVAAL